MKNSLEICKENRYTYFMSSSFFPKFVPSMK